MAEWDGDDGDDGGRAGAEGSGGPAPPRQRRSLQDRREHSSRRLLDAAAQLIADQGFTRTSLAQIGKKAGYSRGLVNERFGSKTGLVRVLADAYRETLAVDWLEPALAEHEGLDRLIVAVETCLDAMEQSGALGRAYHELLGESLALIPEIQETFLEAERALRAGFQRLVEEAADAGEIPPEVDAPALATVAVALLRGVSLQWLRDPTHVDRRAAVREIRRVFELAFTRSAAAATG